MIISFITMIISFLSSFFITPFVSKFAVKNKILDHPNIRKVHKIPIPSIGGISIVFSFYLGIFLVFGFSFITFIFIIPSIFIVIAGILDDVLLVNPIIKLLLQFIASIIFIFLNHDNIFVFLNFQGYLFFLNYISILIWLIGTSNAVNLIDGLDGLAAGVSFISSLTLGIICLLTANNNYAIISFLLSFSILGFIKYNFYPAKIFMGDTGALFLGFILGELSILGTLKGATFISFILPVLILGIPIFDTFWSIVRRLVSKDSIINADKKHLHHRLIKIGFTHKQTVLFIYYLSAILGVTAILIRSFNILESIFLFAIICFILFLLLYKMGLFKNNFN